MGSYTEIIIGTLRIHLDDGTKIFAFPLGREKQIAEKFLRRSRIPFSSRPEKSLGVEIFKLEA